MHHPPITPYLIRELTPYMLKRIRRVVNWGQSPTFARMSFYDVSRELRGQNVIMARSKSGKHDGAATKSTKPASSVKWLNYRLTPEDTAIVLADCEELPALASRVAGLFASGADFSIRYVPERKNYSAFAIAMAREDDGVRTGISAFGGTVWQAIASLLYKCDLFASEPEKLAESGSGLGIG
jgi:hypothetical protein